jgi:Tol biopolymer transport system component
VSFRRKMIRAILAVLAIGVPACSTQTAEEDLGKPTVEIVSPPSGNRVAKGQQVEVQYRAIDPVAVVRVELEVGRRIVDSHNSPTLQGQPSLNGVLRWTPDTAGNHTLLVYAYNRDGVSSDGAAVEIIVSDLAAPEATNTSASETPAKPPDTVVLSDDFSDPNSGLASFATDSHRLGYERGEYFIGYTEQNDTSRWQTYPLQIFSDFTAEVQVRFEAEDDFVGAALIWRWQDNDNFYRFRIRNTGQYDLVKRVDGEWRNLISAASSPHINTGIAVNTMKVVAVGDFIQIYANDQHLADFNDESFAQGRIGLYASVYTGSPIRTSVFFDNLRVSASGEVAGPPSVMAALVYSDEFDDPESGWSVTSGEGYAYGYEDGEYYIDLAGQTDAVRWTTYPDGTFSDLTAEVQVRFDTDVARVGGGLVWRWQDNDNYYRATIYNTGQYGVWKRVEAEWQTKLSLSDCQYITAGVAVNTLKVVAAGDLMQIYVNDQHVADLVDGSFSEGRIGVNVSVQSESPLTGRVHFDNLRVFTSGPVGATLDSYPPPSGRIVFATDRDDPQASYEEVYVANVDGSGQTRLTNYEYDDDFPAWSPDGRKIAFVSWRDGDFEIYVMNADGSDVTRLTDSEGRDLEPRWCPDGHRIVFESERDGNWEIYVMNSDGSGQVNISNNGAEDRVPDWSPDGQWITFSSDRGGNQDVYLMRQDGSGVVNLTQDPTRDYMPAWSPDGQRIAFESSRSDGSNIDIYVMNADGSDVVRLTDYARIDSNPAWAPDGNYIAFSREEADTDFVYDLYIMRSDGSEQTSILSVPGAHDGGLDWAPAP